MSEWNLYIEYVLTITSMPPITAGNSVIYPKTYNTIKLTPKIPAAFKINTLHV